MTGEAARPSDGPQPRGRGTRVRRAARGLVAAFALLIVALLALVVAGLLVSRDIDRSARETFVEDAIPLLGLVDDLETQMLNQQTGQRGYLLTGDEEQLAPYRAGRAQVRAALAEIRARAGDHPELAAPLSRVERQIAALERFYASQIALATSGPGGRERAIERVGRATALFSAFRATAAEMTRVTTLFVEDASADQRSRSRGLIVLFAVVGAAALALAGALMVLVPRRTARLLERVEAERAAAALAEGRTRRLQEVTAALGRATDVEAVTRAVLGEAGADAGSIAVLSPDGSRFQTVEMIGYPPEVAESFREYAADAPLPIPEAVRHGPLWIGSLEETRARWPHLARFHGARSHQAVAVLPLALKGAPMGALALSFAEPRDFSPEERAFHQALAGLCAQALDRARLYEAERRDAARQAFLAEASALLSSSLDPDEALDRLARLAVPRLADWCTVTLAAGGALETVALAHADPARLALARELSRRFPPDPGAAEGVPAVIRTGRAALLPEIDDALLKRATRDPEQLALARRLGLVSALIVPLVARGRTLGALTLAASESGRRFREEDLAFAQDLGRRAGVALDNARLYAREREIARALQQELLPTRLPEIPGVEVAARYLPAGEGIEVGGDFYDLFELGDGLGWVAMLGDVCGKGAQAAALTGLARHTVRAGSDLVRPGQALRRLNRAVARGDRGTQFLTAVYAWLRRADDGLEARLARGGHPPPMVLRAGGEVEELRPRGPLIGVFAEPEFEDVTLRLGPGDALVLYSDGVTEARAPDGEVFGERRLAEVLRRADDRSAEGLARRIESAVAAFQAGPAADDVAVLVLRVAGPS